MPASNRTPDPAFGVYVHWPFCAAKCPYCDFNSHVRHGGVDQTRIANALATEVRSAAERMPDRTVTSIFFGGGTPSLMEPQTIDTIIKAIDQVWRITDDAEITLEANPSSVEAARFKAYRSLGINRVSLGVQALDDNDLRALGRLHTVDDALSALETARSTFDRVSFDLIYARSGQSPRDWETELSRALAFGPDHLSLYQLTIEPGTPFFERFERGTLVVPESDDAAEMYEMTQSLCEAEGLPAYEVSNHASSGNQSRHNLVYWRLQDYAGIGPGAHGRETDGHGTRHATVTESQPEAWAKRVEERGSGLLQRDPITPDQTGDEYLLMGLRLSEGISLSRYRALSGKSVDPVTLDDLSGLGLIEREQDQIRATPTGRPVLNRLIAELSASTEVAL